MNWTGPDIDCAYIVSVYNVSFVSDPCEGARSRDATGACTRGHADWQSEAFVIQEVNRGPQKEVLISTLRNSE